MSKSVPDLQVLDKLVDKAMTKQHQALTLISSLSEGLKIVQYRSAILQVWENFTKLKKNIYKTYIKLLKKGQRDHTLLACFVQMKQCESFYEEEWNAANYFIQEFITYSCSGHTIDVLLGKIRKPEDFWDHLNPPKN